MKKTAFLFLLTLLAALYSPAQTNPTNTTDTNVFDTTDFPQWAKDLRRWEIVAFGSIPFAMFTATFAVDMVRWNNANGMDFSDEGRRYAPWPLKSAGADLMTSKEQETVFLIAGCLAITVAMTDWAIVKIKRHKAKKRADALPTGTTIIKRHPWGDADEPDSAEQGAEAVEEAEPDDTEGLVPEQP